MISMPRHLLPTLVLALGCGACGGSPPPAASGPPSASGPLAQFAFMTGDWFTLGGETEEHWLAPLGDVMIGMGRTRAEGRNTFHEGMRSEMDGSTPVFYAYPNGKAPVPFRLLEGSTTKAVFAN